MANLLKSIIIDGERVNVEMTDSEQEEFETLRASDAAIRAEKIAEKQALYDKLGLSADEVAALLG